MTPSSYLLLSALVTGGVFLVAWTSRKPESPSSPPPEATRWKRFRIHFGALHNASVEPVTLVTEEPNGLKLVAGPRAQSTPRRLKVFKGKDGVIEIVRGFLFFRDRLQVLLTGKHWLQVRLPSPGEKRPQLNFVTPSNALEIQGNVADREFEVRKQGRLVASISWQRGERDSSPRKDYVLESLKGEDPLPLLALVLAVEAAMGPTKS